MRLRNILSFGAFGAIIALSVGYIASFEIYLGPPEKVITLSMDVPDVKGLVAGSRVLLRGVPVGRVTYVDASLNAAKIDFYIDGDQRIPLDTVIRLDNLSALGETYIGLIPRVTEGPMLQDGQHIATEAVTIPPSIAQTATSVVRVLNQLDPGQLERTLREVDAAMPDPQLVLPNLARASLLLRNMAMGLNGSGATTLENFQTLLRNADWVGPNLADMARPVAASGDGLSGTYRAMMNTIGWNNPENIALFGTFVGRIQNFLDSRGPDVKVLAQALTPQFTGIAGALLNFDTGRLLTSALAGVPADGAITLRVTVPDR